MVHHSRCPLCNNNNIVPLTGCTDYLVSKDEFQLFRCCECSFIFTQDYPEESEIGKFYESDEYISHTDSSETLLEKVYQATRKIMLRRKAGLIRRTCGIKTGSILDIGSGTGYFLRQMKDNGWETTGIEVNQKAREYSLRELDIEALPPQKLTSLATGSFDCITMWHVLEHFHEPLTNLSELRRLLKPGGKSVIALPNCESADAVHYKRNWAAYDVPRHLWHFTPDTFELIASKTGLQVNEVRKLPFDVFYISILSEKYKGSRLYFMTGMLKGLWFSILSLFDRYKCSSLIYILVPV
jgi:2-polyprenyl-3-methyl-5-hydroxy-6-metoxy-1,4-benzoquinol methylase